jgi:hypothetical protein
VLNDTTAFVPLTIEKRGKTASRRLGWRPLHRLHQSSGGGKNAAERAASWPHWNASYSGHGRANPNLP